MDDAWLETSACINAGRFPEQVMEIAMKGRKALLVLSTVCASLCAHAPAPAGGLDGELHASNGTVPPLPPAPLPARPLTPKTHNGVTYLCGGVGEEEVARMKSEARHYDMLLTFSARDAGYLADVDVHIADMQGAPVLQTFCGAPMLLVDLPHPGSYRVKAETAGYTLRKTVRVEGRESGTSFVSLQWPQQIAESVTLPQTSGDSGTAGTSAAGTEDEDMPGCDIDCPAIDSPCGDEK